MLAFWLTSTQLLQFDFQPMSGARSGAEAAESDCGECSEAQVTDGATAERFIELRSPDVF